jgi:hypothetical protein
MRRCKANVPGAYKKSRAQRRREAQQRQAGRLAAQQYHLAQIMRQYEEEPILPEKVHLFLHETDQITGDEKTMYTLFYEDYQGYTIYSTEQGHCCIHGAGQRGCLRLQGKFVSFPAVEHAMRLIEYFSANGWTAHLHMNRRVSGQVYCCLNASSREASADLVGV